MPRLLFAIILLATWTGALAERCEYDGAYHAGKPHGFGTCVFDDGSLYEGGFRKGKASGYGARTWTDGTRYEGGWSKGKPPDRPIRRTHGTSRTRRTNPVRQREQLIARRCYPHPEHNTQPVQ